MVEIQEFLGEYLYKNFANFGVEILLDFVLRHIISRNVKERIYINLFLLFFQGMTKDEVQKNNTPKKQSPKTFG